MVSVAALWTRDHDPAAGAGRPRLIAEMRAGPLRDARHVRLHHAFELGPVQRLLMMLRCVWRFVTLRPEPLQCCLYAAPAALAQAEAGIGDATTVYLDGIRCLAAARRLAQPGRRLVCDFHDLMSRRARLQLAASEPPNLGYLASSVPPWLRWALRAVGMLAQRYEAWSLARAEREMTALCAQVVLLSPVERDELAACSGPALAARVVCIPPAQPLLRASAPVVAPLRLIFVGGENLAQNRLTLLRLFHFWRTGRPRHELHWFGRREPGGIEPPPGVVCHGFVADLAATAYDGRSLLLNPSVLAGGVKTKMLEALAYGCPAAGNAAALEGLGWEGYPLLLADDDEAWLHLIAAPEAALDRLNAALVFAKQRLTDQHVPAVIDAAWNAVLCLDVPSNAG